MNEAPGEVVDLDRLKHSCAACGLHLLCLPAGIHGDDLMQLDGLVRSRRQLDPGQTLYAPGNTFGSLFVVRSGSLKSTVTDASGEAQILGFHLPGEIIGFDAIASGQHQCVASALERSSVCDIPFARLNEVATRVPGLQRQLWRVISHEVVNDHEHLVMMGRKQAQERLAIFLQSMVQRQRRLHRDDRRLLLSMSRNDLANYLGLVVETVSRLFSRFQQMGVLDVQRKTISVLDFDKLTALTGDVTNGGNSRQVGNA